MILYHVFANAILGESHNVDDCDTTSQWSGRLWLGWSRDHLGRLRLEIDCLGNWLGLYEDRLLLHGGLLLHNVAVLILLLLVTLLSSLLFVVALLGLLLGVALLGCLLLLLLPLITDQASRDGTDGTTDECSAGRLVLLLSNDAANHCTRDTA